MSNDRVHTIFHGNRTDVRAHGDAYMVNNKLKRRIEKKQHLIDIGYMKTTCHLISSCYRDFDSLYFVSLFHIR